MEDHLNMGLYELYLNHAEQRRLKELVNENINFWEEKIFQVGKEKFIECLSSITLSLDPLRFTNSSRTEIGKRYLKELSEFNWKFLLENIEKFDTQSIARAMVHFENFEIGKIEKSQILQKLEEIRSNSKQSFDGQP
jgi:hypothetical protein